MPTYDYKCDACEHTWEEFHSMSIEPTKKCPTCGKKKARRLIGAGGGVIFKGTGFYQTDYRSDSNKKASDADKAPSTSSDSGGKSDSTTKSDSGSKSDSGTKSASGTKSESKAKPSE